MTERNSGSYGIPLPKNAQEIAWGDHDFKVIFAKKNPTAII